jgi:ankyrin repeat protein
LPRLNPNQEKQMRLVASLAVLFWIALPSAAANMTTVPVSTADRELLIAVSQGHVAKAENLLKAGANVNTAHPPLQLTPLLAASELNFDMVKLLVARGANVNVHDRDGLTPLIRAITLRDLRMVALLVDAGAKIDATDQRGHTALTHAVLRSDADILKLLIARGAETDVISAMGTTTWSIAQNMRQAALIMPERPQEPHHHTAGQAGHAMRSKAESLIQTQAVLDVLVAAGVKQRPQQAVAFDAMQQHRH